MIGAETLCLSSTKNVFGGVAHTGRSSLALKTLRVVPGVVHWHWCHGTEKKTCSRHSKKGRHNRRLCSKSEVEQNAICMVSRNRWWQYSLQPALSEPSLSLL